MTKDEFLHAVKNFTRKNYFVERLEQKTIHNLEKDVKKLAEDNGVVLKAMPKFSLFHNRQVLKLVFDDESIYIELYPYQTRSVPNV